MKQIVIKFILVILVSACRDSGEQTEVPALLTNPGPDTLAEIQQSVSTALDGAPVTLAEDVFTTSSVLVIQRSTQRSIDRPPELGRDLGRPLRFQLVTDGMQCVLVEQLDGQRWPLSTVTCTQEN